MNELIEKLGINWELLLAQVVNFSIILIVLRLTIYKPILSLLKNRRERIEKGLKDADLAEKKLTEAETAYDKKVAEGEQASIKIIENAEKDARKKEVEIIKAASLKEAEIIANADKVVLSKSKEAEDDVYRNASEFLRLAFQKLVEKNPQPIDKVLIDSAVEETKKLVSR